MATKNIRAFTDEELDAEISRRKSLFPAPMPNRPTVQAHNNWMALIDYVEQQLDEGITDPEDFFRCISEELLETIYGPDFFKWWNRT